MPNATIKKFGYPDSLLSEYEHWVVLLRPKQLTAGCMVLACKEDSTSLGEIGRSAATELPSVARDLEGALAATYSPEKINYLALMMVDPHVHFHVIPRYSHAVTIGTTEVGDPGWPKHPAMQEVASLSDGEMDHLRGFLISNWPS